MDYATSSVPEINPNQLFAAGHSSAATMALNFAASAHEIKAVAAYAPVCDVKAHLAPALPKLERVMEGITSFVEETSPRSAAAAPP